MKQTVWRLDLLSLASIETSMTRTDMFQRCFLRELLEIAVIQGKDDAPDARTVLSGWLKARDHTGAECPGMDSSLLAWPKSHKLIAPSSSPDAASLPSGENARLVICRPKWRLSQPGANCPMSAAIASPLNPLMR